MKAAKLYEKLEKDFDLAHCRDDWSKMNFNEFISDNFKKRYMGLLCDNTSEIKKVYTSVFPSDFVITELLKKKEKDVLLFTHHPMMFDNAFNYPFINMSKDLLKKLKDSRISIYTLHTPLDRNGKYSTTVCLAKALGIKPEGEFYEYYGHKVGVYGKTSCKTVEELADKLREAVGHDVVVIVNNDHEITDGKVALVAGGGNGPEEITEVTKLGINTYVTGIIKVTKYPPTREFVKLARANNISIVGGTHYSTEKFACIAICDYFKKLKLPAKFLEDKITFSDIK